MTPEPPPAQRPPRPGVGARRQALGLSAATPAPPARESLRAALARIPDLDDPVEVAAGPAASEVGSDPAVDGRVLVGAAAVGAGATVAAADALPPAVGEPAGGAAPASAPAPFEERLSGAFAEPRTGQPTAEPSTGWTTRERPATWRRVLFALVLIGLVASIPVLAYAGAKVISASTAGNFDEDVLDPSSPGYEAQVDPTPTAVAFQFDEAGDPNAITFLSLAGDDGGGSVVFVPLDTEVSEPAYGVDRLRTAFDVVNDRPALARERLASQTGRS